MFSSSQADFVAKSGARIVDCGCGKKLTTFLFALAALHLGNFGISAAPPTRFVPEPRVAAAKRHWPRRVENDADFTYKKPSPLRSQREKQAMVK